MRKLKKQFKKLITFKNRYKHGDYTFIRVKEWFGIYKHKCFCPNFEYQNTSVILFKWMITRD